jgi:hypothetical protein
MASVYRAAEQPWAAPRQLLLVDRAHSPLDLISPELLSGQVDDTSERYGNSYAGYAMESTDS